jgi:hypothetical protein
MKIKGKVGDKILLEANGRRDKVDSHSQVSIGRCAKRLDIDREALEAELNSYLADLDNPTPIEGHFKAWSPDKPDKLEEQGVLLDLLKRAIDERHYTTAWSPISELAALDIDIPEDGDKYTEVEINKWLFEIVPSPTYLWVTHSGGARGIFTRHGGLTADENAAVFDLLLPDMHVRSQTELLSRTRVPPHPDRIISGYQSTPDLKGRLLARRGLNTYTTSSRDTFLRERGMELGKRYDHAQHCVINPGLESPRNPIVPMEDGIMCYRCGFRAWAQLLYCTSIETTPKLTPVVEAAKELVHWTHARYILEAYHPNRTTNIYHAGYRGLIKLIHDYRDDLDDLLKRVFSPDFDFIRSSSGLWLDDQTQKARVKVSRETFRTLPTGYSVARQDKLAESLPIKGYRRLTPIVGLKAPAIVRPDQPLVDTQTVYIPARVTNLAKKRWEIEHAFDLLRYSLPGWNDSLQAALKTTLVGTMRAQYCPPMPSMVLVTGPTGSGKGAVASLAAGILGRNARKIDMSAGQVELSMSLGEALEQGEAILVIDEVGKIGRFWRESSPLLQLTSTIPWRKLHHGHVVTDFRAALVLLGSTLPTSLAGMAELQRRMPVCQLNSQVGDFASGCKSLFSCGRFEDLRYVDEETNRELANALFWWAREYVEQHAQTPWVDMAYDLGCEPLSSVDTESDTLRDMLIRLYEMWISGQAAYFFAHTHPRYGKRPWLDASQPTLDGCSAPTEVGQLVESWLHDDSDFMQVKGSLETMDVGTEIGLDCPMRLRISKRRQAIAIQFIPANHRNRDQIDPVDRTLYPELP